MKTDRAPAVEAAGAFNMRGFPVNIRQLSLKELERERGGTVFGKETGCGKLFRQNEEK